MNHLRDDSILIKKKNIGLHSRVYPKLLTKTIKKSLPPKKQLKRLSLVAVRVYHYIKNTYKCK